MRNADIAQSVERILGKDEVPGSNPGISSKALIFLEEQGFFLVLLKIFGSRIPPGAVLLYFYIIYTQCGFVLRLQCVHSVHGFIQTNISVAHKPTFSVICHDGLEVIVQIP